MTPLPATLSPKRIAELVASVRPGQGDTTTVRAPFTGDVLVRWPTWTESDLTAAATRASVAQLEWARTPVSERARVLLRLHDAVLDHVEDLLDVIQADTGKSRSSAFEEVADLANVCRYFGRTASATLKAQRRAGVFPLLTRTTERAAPVGLVGLITPWNYPLTLGVSDAIPALVAGNAVLHKPDTQTALTAAMGRELAVKAGLPEALWQIVLGEGGVVGPQLIDRVDHVSFTGSTATGRRVAEQAGRRLIGAGLELGGKNAMIVCADADLGRAVAGAVRGCFSSTGQLCISIERLYLHEAIADEFTRRLVVAVRALRLGPGYDYRHDMGSLISAAQLDRVQAHVADAVARGATVLVGGRARPDLGPYFYEPTVLADVAEDATCRREETFGPVVALYRVGSDEEAVTAANDTRYGLNASVWSRDRRRAVTIAQRLRAGTVNVNESYAAAWGSMDAPMGGWGDSGTGRRHGRVGLLTYTQSQTVAEQRFWPVGEHGPLRGKRYQRAITASLRAMKALHRR